MTRAKKFALFALGTLAVLAPGVFGQAAKKPIAAIVAPVKDFEIVPKGKVLEYTFEIRNDGDATLEISNVRPACGCTVVDFDSTVAPGQVGKIHAKVETDGFSGPIAKTIAVFTNDPENPKLQLVVKAEVKPFLGVSPGYARFNYVQGEEGAHISQKVWAEDGRDLQVLDVKSPYDYLKVSFHEAAADERHPDGQGRQWIVDIQLDPDAAIGALRDYVMVKTDHPEQKTLRIPVTGFVRPRQFVTPESVDFGQIDPASLPFSGSLALINFTTQGIELEIETGFAAIKGEVEKSPNQPGHRFTISLTIEAGMPSGAFEGTLKIHTSDKQHPLIEVPMKGTIL